MVDWQDLEIDEMAEWPLLPQIVVIALLIMVIQGLVIFFTGALDRMIRKPVEGFFSRRRSNDKEAANGTV